ncbi:MAG: VCBS repeat-containing protein [Gemmataceae bacterium]
MGVDWDGDGDVDILSGNTAGYIEFFENLSGPRVARPRWAAPRRLEVDGKPFRIMAGRNGSIQGPAEAKWGYTTFSVADWDGDGRPDIVLNSILGDVVWLRNIGTRNAPKLAAPQPIEVEWTAPQPALAWGWRKPKGQALLTQWRTTPVVYDFTGDGLPDLAMLDHEGYLALFERAKRDGKSRFAAAAARLRERGRRAASAEPPRRRRQRAAEAARRRLGRRRVRSAGQLGERRRLPRPGRRGGLWRFAGRGRWPGGTSRATTSARRWWTSTAMARPDFSAAPRTAGSTSATRGRRPADPLPHDGSLYGLRYS